MYQVGVISLVFFSVSSSCVFIVTHKYDVPSKNYLPVVFKVNSSCLFIVTHMYQVRVNSRCLKRSCVFIVTHKNDVPYKSYLLCCLQSQ